MIFRFRDLPISRRTSSLDSQSLVQHLHAAFIGSGTAAIISVDSDMAEIEEERRYRGPVDCGTQNNAACA